MVMGVKNEIQEPGKETPVLGEAFHELFFHKIICVFNIFYACYLLRKAPCVDAQMDATILGVLSAASPSLCQCIA